MNNILRQAGAIPFRHDQEGLRVILIMSRDTGRWVIPKGNIEKTQTAAQAAALEAYEEAGVKGTISEIPLGLFTYSKRLSSGALRPTTVEVYALQVKKQLKKWPERRQRQYKWMPVCEAEKLVDEPGMIILLRRLEQIEAEKVATVKPKLPEL
jgi:8-oxo-dGTP pyrophosphatase MutT (NUDIX family)